MRLDPKLIRSASIMSAAVLVKGILIFSGLWLGIVIDRKLGTSPIFMMVLVSAGTFIGLWWVIFVAKRSKL